MMLRTEYTDVLLQLLLLLLLLIIYDAQRPVGGHVPLRGAAGEQPLPGVINETLYNNTCIRI